jgi:glycosyl-4,4'-diaponeurosporenoate acyltransferase
MIRPMVAALIAINTAGWLAVQLGIAWAATHTAPRYFSADNWLYKVRAWEIGFYRRCLRIRRWKRLLPDGAPWVGGRFAKKTLKTHDPEYLRQWMTETRRAELAHWLMLACFPIFFLWNPRWAWIVMALYAAAANLPCIVVQRYNRAVLGRLRSRRRGPRDRSGQYL